MCGVENLYHPYTLTFNILFTDVTKVTLKLEDIM